MTSNNKTIIPQERKRKLFILIKKLIIDPIALKKITGTNSKKINIINEALTHTSANSLINHERLEFIGDSVLRLAATEFIEKHFPSMKVGDRSELRSELVSDKWLAKIGQKISIEDVFLLGKKASKDKSAIETFRAESTEALIGAIYECLHDLEPIHQWLTPHWEEESEFVLADPHKHNFKSALQELSQKRTLNLPDYKVNEISKEHGSSKRFFCKVYLDGKEIGKGWGRSRKEAEKDSARNALKFMENIN